MLRGLPQNTNELMTWSWDRFGPFYENLAGRTLDSASVLEWLADWTAIDDCITELQIRLEVATSQDTANEQAKARFVAFLDHVFPHAEAAEQRLREKLLASGLEPQGFSIPLKKMRAAAELFRDENLPLLTEEQKLSTEYDKIIVAQTVEWQGHELTTAQLRPVFMDPDRTKREQAWRLAAARELADRDRISVLWARFLKVREQIAANAGMRSYRDYRWKELYRFDYTPADCRRFHDAIEQVVVPAARVLYEKRRVRLGLKSLRPWDLEVDPAGRPPLRPFEGGEQLAAIGGSIFHRVDPQLGGYFDSMIREGLLDLDNRKSKAPGGYCTFFPLAKRPFIFMNAVGVHEDLQTLLHEAGHAFHGYERYRLPLAPQRNVGSEFGEVASMSMELLAAPYLARDQGGVYSSEDAARARREHLESNILFWPYMAVVDAFQHWVYENPEKASDRRECDAAWSREWQRFMIGVDWDGLSDIAETGWQRKLHIHQLPFYYVEYGLAQLGAMQIWRNALHDQAGALNKYKRALALGGTVSLPALYGAAGAKLAFDAETLESSVKLALETIESLETRG